MSSQVGSYYYTARAGEQLHVSSPIQQNKAASGSESVLSDYISTTEQTAVMGHKENQAVYFNAMANFALNKSSAVSNLNQYNLKTELNNKLGLN